MRSAAGLWLVAKGLNLPACYCFHRVTPVVGIVGESNLYGAILVVTIAETSIQSIDRHAHIRQGHTPLKIRRHTISSAGAVSGAAERNMI